MKKKISLSVVIPAYNEEQNIEVTVLGAEKILSKKHIEYEILVIDDGSHDRTGEICERLSTKYPHLRVIHNKHNIGFGPTYRVGISQAKKDYITGLPGDNDTSPQLLADFIDAIGEADVLIAYMQDMNKRPWWRRVYSQTYIVMMNALFGLHLKYFNGYLCARTDLLRSIPLKSDGFTIFAEAKVRLLSRGATYKEIPFDHLGRQHGVSKAFSVKSMMQALRNMWEVWREIRGARGIRRIRGIRGNRERV